MGGPGNIKDLSSSSRKEGVPLAYALVSLGISVTVSLVLGLIARDYLHLQHSQRVDPRTPEFHIESDVFQDGLPRPSWIIPKNSHVPKNNSDETDDRIDEEEDDDETENDVESGLPSITQLFIDLEKVPHDLIRNADNLEELMNEVLEKYEPELISHSCHESANESSIVCLGILEDRGHVSLHAWPQNGSVLLDLLIPGQRFIMDEMAEIYEIFHPNMPNQFDPKNNNADLVEQSTWSTRSRASDQYSSDYEGSMATPSETKYKVASLKTAFQQVDVFDILTREDRVNLKEYREKAPEYIKANPNLFLPDRSLFLDGVLQSTLHGNAAYHEALVQPSMFAHPNPKRVAIIGGGECATLREVLKHKTVERAVMIEIDPEVVEASKHALPSWNDCSNFEGSSRYCMDDPRAQIYNDDAFKWFIDRYLGKNQTSDEDLFDVIIMDALDPQDVVEFAKALYGDSSFLGALYGALTHDGILITQVGNAPVRGEVPEHESRSANRAIYSKSLAQQGFESIADYSEDHTGFEEPWYFYAAFKDRSTRANWMATESEINLKIQKRAIRTIDESSPFEYFDGATMKMYQYPSQASVDLFCRREPTPVGCDRSNHGFDPERPNYSEAFFNVTTSLAGKHAGRGVFTKANIPKGSYLTLEAMVYPVTIEGTSTLLISKMSHHSIAEEYCTFVLEAFAYGYGYSSTSFGEDDKLEVDSGLVTFVNHGCNGTSNLGVFPYITESSVDLNDMPHALYRYRMTGDDYVFNPAVIRDTTFRLENINRSGKLNAGDELLENYYEQVPIPREWRSHVHAIQKYCSGGVGEVSQYQVEWGEDEEEKLHINDLHSGTAEMSSLGEITMLSTQ